MGGWMDGWMDNQHSTYSDFIVNHIERSIVARNEFALELIVVHTLAKPLVAGESPLFVTGLVDYGHIGEIPR